MDPITAAIVLAITAGATSGLTKVAEGVIVDSYEKLKSLISSKLGESNKVTKAVNELEEKPESEDERKKLKEAVSDSQIDKDSEILTAAKELLTLIESTETTVINQKVVGNNVVQVGEIKGNLTIER